MAQLPTLVDIVKEIVAFNTEIAFPLLAQCRQ
jgi:hypothetical protein